MPDIIFTMQDLKKVVPPKREILKGIWLSFFWGAKIGVLGHNGAGKSTLLKIMAGIEKEFDGEAFPDKKAKVGFLAQEPQLDPSKTVLENVMDGVGEVKELLDRFNVVSDQFADPDLDPDKMDDSARGAGQAAGPHRGRRRAGNWRRRWRSRWTRCVVPPDDADVSKLSGGEQRRVALCRLLLQKPDLLLLDEPTNHLDAESVGWLERHLKDYPGSVVAITHDRYFLDNVAGWILELDRGAGIPWEGNYSSWLDQKQNRLAQEEKANAQHRRTLQRELEWVRMAPRARQAKSKARLGRYEELLREGPAAGARDGRDLHSSGPASRRRRDRGRGV